MVIFNSFSYVYQRFFFLRLWAPKKTFDRTVGQLDSAPQHLGAAAFHGKKHPAPRCFGAFRQGEMVFHQQITNKRGKTWWNQENGD